MFSFLRRNRQTESQAQQPEEQRALDWSLAEIFGIAPTAAGVSVSPQAAMRVPAVRAAVLAISEAAGQLPLHVYRRASHGARERYDEHPAHILLNRQACPWMGGGRLREQLVRDALLHGNGFAYIHRANGSPRELLRLSPQAVQIEVDDRSGEPFFRITETTGSTRIFGSRDILHLAAPSTSDGITGVSPIEQGREAIALAIALEAYASRLFANGGRPGGILSFPGKLGADAAKKVKAAWQAAFSGSGSGGTALLDEGANYVPLAFKSTDAQFLELRQFAIDEIARIFRVPPVLLMNYLRQTWANAETGGQQFLTYSLAPWLLRIESEVNLKLLQDEDGTFAEHLTDSLLRADFAARASAYAQYRSMGVMTSNEVRAGLNLPPRPDGDSLANPYTSSGGTSE